MASIFFAVVLSIITSSLQQGIFDNLVKNVVSFYSGYIQVHQKGYWDEQIIDNSFAVSADMEKKIKEDDNVTDVTPRLESFALISSLDVTKGCMVMGIDPEKENRITRLKEKVIKGSYLEDSARSVLLAEGLAQRLKVSVGDTITIIGQGYHGSTAAGKYPVKGVLRFGSPQLNDQMVMMPLQRAQELYGATGLATGYILSLKKTPDMDETAAFVQAKLGTQYEVMTWEEIMPDIKQHIRSDTNNMKVISGILYLLIFFGIFGTLSMMMIERRFEMGMLVAIGMKKGKLALLLLYESILIVLTGCILGILASIPVVHYLNRNPIRMGGETAKAFERFGFEPVFPTSTDPVNFFNQGMIVFVIGLLLSFYPIYKVIVLNPLTAMKR
ncbi:FtsX-like permease family protein [Chryseobacterium gotjawalense]|uniref:FtsX-like permease family protein n=1 Tax=Chryseobacterium gotjawalense TaxID=3042315 RepID=A0ABY8RIK8_9FLAO|nr:FtsX-like permease family protein [Chryseobacterium sp. wdc7]WHF53109.1 FtsX-like permease family protein [Chryseobacterium sp. wdc7]